MNRPPVAPAPSPAAHKLSRDTLFVIGDLLPLCDFIGLLVAAYLGTLAYAIWIAPGAPLSGIWEAGGRAALAAAVLAPLILCDRTFVLFASGGDIASLIRCYAVRFVMFAGAVAIIGFASDFLDAMPREWLALWLAATLLVTSTTRVALAALLRHLEHNGVLAESVAVVGAGPVADRLIRHLLHTRGDHVEILGVFDDRHHRSDGCVHQPAGGIDELIELGKSRPVDWILLTLPSSADQRVQALVHRLKTLAVPVGLCPQNVGLAVPCEIVHYVGDGVPVTMLADRPASAWDRFIAALQIVVPGWIITVLGLPLAIVRFAVTGLRQPSHRTRASMLACTLDDYDLTAFTRVAATFGQQRFGYVVTPNADHMIRLHREPSFRTVYTDAAYVLLDSRFLSHLLRLTKHLQLPVCTGSDLTANLFEHVIQPEDHVVLVGGSDDTAARLTQRYGLKQLAHFNPPMGFIRDPAAVESCLRFVESQSPFRYCLLAVGAPQQEVIAQQLKARGVARGLALCIGASINFLTGEERRAPSWMQHAGIEWLFRLLQAPGRMAQRYLVRGPQIFGLLRHTEIILRKSADAAPRRMPATLSGTMT